MKFKYTLGLVSVLAIGSVKIAMAEQDNAQPLTAQEQAKAQYEQTIARQKEAQKQQFAEREAQLAPQRKAAKEKIQKLPEKYKH